MITLWCFLFLHALSESCNERAFVDWSKVGSDPGRSSDLILAELKCSNLFHARNFNWNGFYNHFEANYLDDEIFQKGINWFDKQEKTYLGLDPYKSYLSQSFVHPSATLVLISDQESHQLNFTFGSESISCQLDKEVVKCQHCGAAPQKNSNFNQFRIRHRSFLAESTDHKSAQLGLAFDDPLKDSIQIPSDHLWSVQVLVKHCNMTVKVKQ